MQTPHELQTIRSSVVVGVPPASAPLPRPLAAPAAVAGVGAVLTEGSVRWPDQTPDQAHSEWHHSAQTATASQISQPGMDNTPPPHLCSDLVQCRQELLCRPCVGMVRTHSLSVNGKGSGVPSLRISEQTLPHHSHSHNPHTTSSQQPSLNQAHLQRVGNPEVHQSSRHFRM